MRSDTIPVQTFISDQPVTVQQYRTLTNFGVKSDLAYVKGRHNAKAGIQISQTNLMEDFHLAVTDPTFNPVCLTSTGAPVLDPDHHRSLGMCCRRIPGRIRTLRWVSLHSTSRAAARMFHFHEGAHIKEQAAYVEDAITVKQFISQPWRTLRSL